MIILFDSIFGHGKMIIFHLIEWVATHTKTLTKALRECRNRLTFPAPAVPTRHEVTCKSADREEKYDQADAQN